MSTTLISPRPTQAQPVSAVLGHATGSAESATRYFEDKLAHECDPSDLSADLDRGIKGFVVIDARHPDSYAAGHVPGAINIPHRTITPDALSRFPDDTVFVTYCTGVNCNAATKAALRIGRLGYQVKEMIGGFEYWKREGHAVEGGSPAEAKACEC